MSLQRVAPHGRLLANCLTLALAAFGACGWIADDELALPTRIVLAIITVLAQQLANLAAAGAAIAYNQGRPVVCAGAVMLTAVLGGGGGYSVAHAHDVFDALRARAALAQHADERARAERELRQLEIDSIAAAAALRAIPANVPTRRIVALQRPLNDAIARADARRAVLEQRLETLSRPPAPTPDEQIQSRLVGIWFWILALAEPGLYWLMAALSQAVPAPRGTSSVRRREAVTRVPIHLDLRAGVAAILSSIAAMLGAHAAAEPAAQSPPSHLHTCEPSGIESRAHETGQDAGRDKGQLLRQAQALQARGFSLRRIARTLAVKSKSTFQRMLAAAARREGEGRPNS